MSSATVPPVFLSVRLSSAARGETVQSLVGKLVERFLAEEERHAPGLAAMLGTLRTHAHDLKSRGIARLGVFGSVARGDARPDSDVDLLADLDPDAHLSLVGLASLRAELSEMLGVPADLVERSALHPAVRAAAEREAVQAW